MAGFSICVGVEICQASESNRIVRGPGFWIPRFTEGLLIFANIQGSENASGCSHRRVLNIPGLQINHFVAYARFWIWPNVLDLPEYGLRWLAWLRKLFFYGLILLSFDNTNCVMQNTIQKFRQSSFVFEKPGILSENLKTLTISNYPTVQYFLLELRTRFLLTNDYKRICGIFFILFRSWVICKI